MVPADRRPVRCLHVFPSFEVGGSQMRTARLIDGLGDAFRHQLVSLSGRREALDLLSHPERVKLFAAPPKAGSARTTRALAGLIGRERPDLVLTYNFGALDGLLAARIRRRPAVHHEDGFGPDEALARKPRRSLLRRLVLPGARAVVVPSERLFEIATREWRLAPPRLVLIPNGIDLDRFGPDGPRADLEALGLDPRLPTAIALGSLRREKNLARAIAALESLPSGLPAQLLIVGDGPERAALQARAAASGARARIAFAGAQRDPSPFVRAAALLVLSSDTEQMPLSLVEAMAAGLPVAAEDVGDVRRMLPEAQAPCLVALPPAGAGTDPEAGAAALGAAWATLLSDPGLRRELGRANRQRALERYGFERMLGRYRELYGGLARGSSTAS